MLKKELETAIDIARKAGKSILGYYSNGFEIEEKISSDGVSSPVTIADQMSSKIIVKGLAEIFPNDEILSEEEFDNRERLEKQRVWVIDPLDGTKGFIEKNGDFAVQIGLAVDGIAVLGVVYLPSENILYFASQNNGAWLSENEENPIRLSVSGETDFTAMAIASSRNHHSPRMTRIVEKFGLKKEVRRDSVGIKVGLIARQICDLYIHPSTHTKHWDTCAPEVILHEAGGQMTDLFGEKIVYNTPDVKNSKGILASNGISHDLAVANMKVLLAELPLGNN
jgi:3'(2'), 5'-bisphosphate nucleotidase